MNMTVKYYKVFDDNAVLKAEIAELEAKVERLKLDDAELNEIKAEAIREMMDSLLAEFASRDSGDLIYEIYQYAKNLEKIDGRH